MRRTGGIALPARSSTCDRRTCPQTDPAVLIGDHAAVNPG